jgi:hypothetical protein
VLVSGPSNVQYDSGYKAKDAAASNAVRGYCGLGRMSLSGRFCCAPSMTTRGQKAWPFAQTGVHATQGLCKNHLQMAWREGGGLLLLFGVGCNEQTQSIPDASRSAIFRVALQCTIRNPQVAAKESCCLQDGGYFADMTNSIRIRSAIPTLCPFLPYCYKGNRSIVNCGEFMEILRREPINQWRINRTK